MLEDQENQGSQEDQADFKTHFEDAKSFFEEESKEYEKKTKEKGSEDSSKGPQTQGEDLLSSIGVKLPSVDSKEETKDATTTVEDDDLAPPPEDSPNRANWDILKTRKNEAIARVQELEAQLAEKGDDASTEAMRSRLKELESENERFSTRLKELDFKSHPEYFNKYEQPIQNAQAELKALAKSEGLDVNVEALASLKGKEFAQKVDEVLEDLSRFNGAQFSEVARQLQKTIQERDTVSADSEQFIQQSNERFHAETRRIFDEVSSQYAETFTPLEIPDDASDEVKDQINAYNNDLSGVQGMAEQIAFGTMDNAQVARIANEAAQYRFMMSRGLPQLANNAGAKIAELQAELDGIKSAGPQYRQTSASNPKSMHEMSNEDAANEIQWR